MGFSQDRLVGIDGRAPFERKLIGVVVSRRVIKVAAACVRQLFSPVRVQNLQEILCRCFFFADCQPFQVKQGGADCCQLLLAQRYCYQSHIALAKCRALLERKLSLT
jgi:hypothetical protein